MTGLLCVFLYILDKNLMKNTIKLSKVDKKIGKNVGKW